MITFLDYYTGDSLGYYIALVLPRQLFNHCLTICPQICNKQRFNQIPCKLSTCTQAEVTRADEYSGQTTFIFRRALVCLHNKLLCSLSQLTHFPSASSFRAILMSAVSCDIRNPA